MVGCVEMGVRERCGIGWSRVEWESFGGFYVGEAEVARVSWVGYGWVRRANDVQCKRAGWVILSEVMSERRGDTHKEGRDGAGWGEDSCGTI